MQTTTAAATFSPERHSRRQLELRPAPHYALLIVHVVVLACCVGFAGMFDHPLWWIAMAAVCGATMVQIGFVGHDVEHGHVSRQPILKRWLGMLCWNLLLGLSARWWQDKHRSHHQHTHVIGEDPDLYALYAFDGEQASGATGFHRLFVRHQHWLFWASLAFARLYFQWLSLVFLLRPRTPRRWTELCLLCAHHAGFWWAAFLALPQHALPFIAISYLVTGLYMGIVFCTNHLGMPHAHQSGEGKRWQIAHTRNIRSGRIGDYLFGGLNYQIEHHLYPSLNRFRLRPMVESTRRLCQDSGLPYHEQDLVTALRDIHAAFRTVAAGMKR